MAVLEDLTGRKFGRLTPLRVDTSKSKGQGAYWECKCDCGNTVTVIASSLKRGNTKSCGCFHKEVLARVDRTKINHKKHGAFEKQEQKERLYTVWKGMKARCYRENHSAYPYYGGRGIKVCDSWRNDYAAFREWAMENGYDPDSKRGECTIDRIDNNGDYQPGNCRFVPMSVQSMNKRPRGSVKKSCGRCD